MVEAILEHIIGKHKWENRGDGLSFYRLFNESWGCEQLGIRLHHPPKPCEGPSEADFHTTTQVGSVRLSSENAMVVWEEGFRIKGDRKDLAEGEETYVVVARRIMPLDEACRRFEDATALPRKIRDKQAEIDRLTQEVEALKRQQQEQSCTVGSSG